MAAVEGRITVKLEKIDNENLVYAKVFDVRINSANYWDRDRARKEAARNHAEKEIVENLDQSDIAKIYEQMKKEGKTSSDMNRDIDHIIDVIVNSSKALHK